MKQATFVALIVWISVMIISLLPAVADAQGGIWDTLNMWRLEKPFGETWTLLDVVAVIINLAFGVAGIVAVIYLIMGGFGYVTAGGNPETLDTAKAKIVNSIIGLVVILISYLIVQFVLSRIGATNISLDRPSRWD